MFSCSLKYSLRQVLTVSHDLSQVCRVLEEVHGDDGVVGHEVSPQELGADGLHDEGLRVVLQQQLRKATGEVLLVRHVVRATYQLRLRYHEGAVG